MKKNNNFNKKAITSVIISVFSLIIIGGYYLLASADGDSYSDKLSITGIKIAQIEDGTIPFDGNNDAGNDSGNNNNIVRTFDSVNYKVNYTIIQKLTDSSNQTENPDEGNEEPTNENTPNDENPAGDSQNDSTQTDRSIIVGVLVPSTITANVFFGGSTYSMTNVFNGYKYAEFDVQGSITGDWDNSFNFSLTNIYGANASSFTPIIVLRESTDSATKSISTLSDEEQSQSLDTVLQRLGGGSSCEEGINCNVTISGKEDYFVKLYKGTHKVEGKDTNMAVGFMIGIENKGEKQIKGVLYPTTVNFDIEISQNNANDILYEGNNIKPYEQDDEYAIYTDDSHSTTIPGTCIGVGTEKRCNGSVSATFDSEHSKLAITVDGINFYDNNIFEPENDYYLSTNSFVVKSSRKSYSENTEDITINFTAKQGATILSEIQDVDKLGRFVGPFQSRIYLYDDNFNRSEPVEKEPGVANLNYGEYFYLREDVRYSLNNVGSSLKNINNFIKIDNEAIKLITYDTQADNEIQPDHAAVNNTTAKAYYYYGQWNRDYIKMKDDAPSSCPDINSFSEGELKEKLMNLYGGPCIEFIMGEGKVQVKEHFDEEQPLGPMAIQVTINPSEGNENGVPIYSDWHIWHKAKILDNPDLEGSVRQISSSSTALFNDNDGQDVLYYLSSETDKNDKDSMMNPNNYTKTNYDFSHDSSHDNRGVVNSHSTICGVLDCAITGNSILVSAIRVAKPTIKSYSTDTTSRETKNFYYYPIEWRIGGTAYKSTNNSDVRYNNAHVKVYFPSYLQRIEYGSDDGNVDIIGNPEEETVTRDGKEYKVYTYTLEMKNKSDVSFVLPIYTNIYLNAPDNENPVVYAEVDYDVTYENGNYYAVTPTENYRSVRYDEVTIHNQADVNTQGTTTPPHIEKYSADDAAKGTYTFKMEAYNNSSNNNSYANAALYYVLPYKGDSAYSELSSKFVSTGYKVKIPSLPIGYKAYYTNGPSSTIITEEINTTSTKTHEWVEWSNTTEEKTNITAIKIEKNTAFNHNEFFGGNDGISVEVTPIGSGVGDIYYNAFYLIADRPSGSECVPTSEDDTSCDHLRNTRIFFNSNRSSTSVYNRQISGFVWEDYDYSGLYGNEETKMENIPVSLCKVSDESKAAPNYNKIDYNTYVKNTDQCLKETVTDENGEFIVNGITEGDYYVKYTFDNKKYTVTDYKVISTEGPSDMINSKGFQLSGTNIAVSHVITFSNEDRVMKRDYVNLGLKIKKQFEVDINKYITKTELTENGETTTKNYNNSTKVSLNVKNAKGSHVRVTYSFVIENVKYFPGYVGLIIDIMPRGMTFNSNLKENQDWIQMGNVLYYNGLSKRLLLPNEKYYFNLVLDLDIKKGGNYINIVSTDDLILMGDEVPNYNFLNNSNQTQTGNTGNDSTSDNTNNNNNNNNSNETETNGEGN